MRASIFITDRHDDRCRLILSFAGNETNVELEVRGDSTLFKLDNDDEDELIAFVEALKSQKKRRE